MTVVVGHVYVGLKMRSIGRRHVYVTGGRRLSPVKEELDDARAGTGVSSTRSHVGSTIPCAATT